MENDHKNRRILRTLFSICHNLYQVSAGECQHPLHILLADSLDSYSGSTKLVTMFNTFGIVCSKKKSKEYITSIVNKKLSSKFIDDLNLNAFTIVSVDNIDFGQPNACVRLDGSRGIHATSYQAVQPKPNAIKSKNVDVKSGSIATNRLELLNFSLSQTERNAMSQTEKSMFQYIIQKLASDDGDIKIPNLKSNMEAFGDSTTEKANVVYLGVIDAPCDNIETIRHTLEKIHETLGSNLNCSHVITVGDANTYDLFCKLKIEYADELSWVLPFPGDWHILKNTQPVLLKAYFDAGLKDIAKLTHKEDGLLTILQQCTNFRKTHLFLLDMWESFYSSQLLSFFDYRNSKHDLSDFTCKQTTEKY
ncbi:unnamed protein product [Mytilus edulis]|uniref:Uncharacterized protein n=1 Tax=Mytilus edulis TaxID=6550 RepID=A0A8S3U5H6_MYTED|nr:unnamed protein product [Mytilus edulis]